MMWLYKRAGNSVILKWCCYKDNNNIVVQYGGANYKVHTERFPSTMKSGIDKEIESRIAAKRKEGYKYAYELHDNAPVLFENDNAELAYVERYLPKVNVGIDGVLLPMLAKTLEDNKPFEKTMYNGQWKINGVRCLVGAEKTQGDLFNPFKLTFHSREGVYWELPHMEEYLKTQLNSELIDMMIEEGVELDGELYLPGYTVNEINSFVKNSNSLKHKDLQYWMYDAAIENMPSNKRYDTLLIHQKNNLKQFYNKEEHLNNKSKLVLLDTYFNVANFEVARYLRDRFVKWGFEGLILRNPDAEYQFGKRNSSMYKYKPIYDGYFTIVDIVPEGKRTNLPKFVCRNDINGNLFECTINKPHSVQEAIFADRKKYIGKNMFVEYRERSGVEQVPFHAKGINIID